MADIKEQSDRDLAAAAIMLVNELSRIQQELVRRGIEGDHTHYSTGKITATYSRVTTEKIA